MPLNSQKGFSYALVLAAAVIVGIVAQAAQLTAWRVLQADREAELLFRGRAYVEAIRSYRETHGVFPRALKDLLDDPRSPGRRHLRAAYADPMVAVDAHDGGGSWLLVRAADGGIVGVTSGSTAEPLKKAEFPIGLERFDGAASYRDWVFEYVPPPPVMNKTPAPGQPSGI